MQSTTEKTYSVKVEGMTCGNCALTISRFLEKQGLKDVSANSGTGEVIFSADNNTDVERLYKGINGLGYKVIQEQDEHRHGHDHDAHDHSGISKLLIVSALFTFPLLLHMFVGHDSILNAPRLQLALCLPVYFIGLYHFGSSAYRSLKNGVPNMDVLITLGASAAFIYSLVGMFFYAESAHNFLFFETTATIITFVLLGNWIEQRTVKATTSAIKSLAKLQPATARLIMKDSIGKETVMDVESKYLKVNDIVLVRNGDSIPVDGIIDQGSADVDESMINGESLPVTRQAGDRVVGGSLLVSGNARVRATAVGEATALAEIIRLVQKAQGSKPPMQKLADKISAVFVPVVLAIAILTFLINYFVAGIAVDQSIMRSVAVLVIACPCAMGLATPAAVAVGLGRAARNGILIKGGQTLERFKDITNIVFDKTGTLTTGNLRVDDYMLGGLSDDEFKSAVVGLEQYSAHPIARSLMSEWRHAEAMKMKDVHEDKGAGISGFDVQGNEWKLGSYRLVEHLQDVPDGFDVFLLKNGLLVGAIRFKDDIRADAKDTVGVLLQRGYKTILLSGDRKEKVVAVAEEVGIKEYKFGQSPNEKMQELEKLSAQGATAMVGDGINDAPSLAGADIGIALSDATHVAMQSANVVLSKNELLSLPKALKLGLFTYQTIRQNLFWAFFYNVLAIPLAAMGYLSPIWAAVVMACSDVILVLNSLRLNYRKID